MVYGDPGRVRSGVRAGPATATTRRSARTWTDPRSALRFWHC